MPVYYKKKGLALITFKRDLGTVSSGIPTVFARYSFRTYGEVGMQITLAKETVEIFTHGVEIVNDP